MIVPIVEDQDGTVLIGAGTPDMSEKRTVGVSTDSLVGDPVRKTEGYPLPVVPDWEKQVKAASKLADAIDQHLDFEKKLQGRELGPLGLCSEQKVSLATDVRKLTRGNR